MHARITAHKGILVVELVQNQVTEDGGRSGLDKLRNLGTIVHDTRRYLGVSDEALGLLKIVKRGLDRIGDFAWFRSDDGMDHFAWLGGPKRLVDPKEVATARSYEILAHQVIPNEVPEGARAAIEANF
ncbi:hypothetical protein LMG31506_04210 [Cupriavidus yeoncheonensis]|uniref:Uncharacterized protein n=1 Tax=Cupriavidus yeoncheonensis TaxID=1462994 RepID=A0A916IX10_9BURK|nr:hypothetical protein [Cupriavidus yeoncheonensis]CAG2150516.1 hypothetical protein LMG31506_04210 [Cupriavidus yeoncheonensis]